MPGKARRFEPCCLEKRIFNVLPGLGRMPTHDVRVRLYDRSARQTHSSAE